MTGARIYHTVMCHLIVFVASCALAPALLAQESKKLLDVWPLGKTQQYIFMSGDDVIGEQWMELRKIPRTEGRYELVSTIDVDGVPYGHPWKSWGESVCELDEWGRPVAYDCEVYGPTEDDLRTVHAVVNYPQVDFFLTTNGEEQPPYSQPLDESARLVDFIFLGPYDLAFRLQPFSPQARVIERDWIVPNMQMAVAAELDVLYEETIVTPDGTEYPTVRIDAPSLLLDLWVAPGGKLVKAEIASPPTTVYAGKTVLPESGRDESSDP
jgi:hypothetical protein